VDRLVTTTPATLPNYQARGFRIFLVESKLEQLPDAPLEA
jgi:hypothetical protein